MNLNDHKTAILLWVESCVTDEQLTLLINVTNNFIVAERFVDTHLKDIIQCHEDLMIAIDIKKEKILSL